MLQRRFSGSLSWVSLQRTLIEKEDGAVTKQTEKFLNKENYRDGRRKKLLLVLLAASTVQAQEKKYEIVSHYGKFSH